MRGIGTTDFETINRSIVLLLRNSNHKVEQRAAKEPLLTFSFFQSGVFIFKFSVLKPPLLTLTDVPSFLGDIARMRSSAFNKDGRSPTSGTSTELSQARSASFSSGRYTHLNYQYFIGKGLFIMKSPNRWNWDLVFRYLMVAILIMVGILIVCPLIRFITSLGLTTIIPIIQFYVGLASIITSGLSLLLLLILTRHPHYDYLVIFTIGMIAGIMSV